MPYLGRSFESINVCQRRGTLVTGSLFGIILLGVNFQRRLWFRPLYHLFVLVNHGGAPSALADVVGRSGMSYQVGVELEQLDENGATAPDAVLLDMSSLEEHDARRLVELCHDHNGRNGERQSCLS